MSKILIDEATVKLALEALEKMAQLTGARWALENSYAGHLEAITALREALAEREAVLPGGGHVPAVPVAVYGYCPECGGAGVMRERRPNGDDKCTNGHKYPSSKALTEQPAQQEPEIVQRVKRYAGQTMRTARNPNITARECIELANWIVANTTPQPAQRTWVGLTDEEKGLELLFDTHGRVLDYEDYADAIEAKLKEKNT